MKDHRKTKKDLINELQDLRIKITEFQKREETSLLLLQNPNSIVLRIDRDGNFTFINEFAQRFFGYSEDELLGNHIVGTIVPETNTAEDEYNRLIQDIFLNPKVYETIEYENICSNGDKVWIAWTFRAISGTEGEIDEIICVGNDISRQRFIEEELKKVTLTDLLTGFSTRRDFIEKFEQEKYRFSRNKKTFSVVMSEIRNYKEITETYGPDCGDYILKKIAEVYKESIRRSDIVGRWAGEEFIILLPETELQGGAVVSEKILSNIASQKITFESTDIPVNICFCVGVYEQEMKLNDLVDTAYDRFDEIKPEDVNKIITL